MGRFWDPTLHHFSNLNIDHKNLDLTAEDHCIDYLLEEDDYTDQWVLYHVLADQGYKMVDFRQDFSVGRGSCLVHSHLGGRNYLAAGRVAQVI